MNIFVQDIVVFLKCFPTENYFKERDFIMYPQKTRFRYAYIKQCAEYVVQTVLTSVKNN